MTRPPRLPGDPIARAAASVEMAEAELRGAIDTRRRYAGVVQLRRRVAEEARDLGWTLVEIADLLGYRDHTPVINLLTPRQRSR